MRRCNLQTTSKFAAISDALGTVTWIDNPTRVARHQRENANEMTMGRYPWRDTHGITPI